MKVSVVRFGMFTVQFWQQLHCIPVDERGEWQKQNQRK